MNLYGQWRIINELIHQKYFKFNFKLPFCNTTNYIFIYISVILYLIKRQCLFLFLINYLLELFTLSSWRIDPRNIFFIISKVIIILSDCTLAFILVFLALILIQIAVFTMQTIDYYKHNKKYYDSYYYCFPYLVSCNVRISSLLTNVDSKITFGII